MADEITVDMPDFIRLTADIVSSYVGHNSMSVDSLRPLIADVHTALRGLGAPAPTTAEPPKPAVSIRRSVTPEYIICLEDGLKFKSLKRHLSTKYGLSPDQYREKWSLPADYPMVAPRYSEQRSALAKGHGLGRKAADAADPSPTAAPTRRARAAK